MHLAYFTAEVDDLGSYRTLPDLYGYDGPMKVALGLASRSDAVARAPTATKRAAAEAAGTRSATREASRPASRPTATREAVRGERRAAPRRSPDMFGDPWGADAYGAQPRSFW